MPLRWRVARPNGTLTLVVDDAPLAAKLFVEREVIKRGATAHGGWVKSGVEWELETSIGKYVIIPAGAL